MPLPDNYLDCRGKLCPVPLLEARRAVEAMPEGDLIVVVDRLAARENIARAMVEAGHEVLVEESEGGWVLTVTKCPSPEEAAVETVPDGGPTTVFLVTDRGLGRADPELGRILMRSFLHTLSQAASLPAGIILIQSGVRLVCEGSDCLDALRTLEQRGVPPSRLRHVS